MKTNKILVVGAMVVGCLVATGCSGTKDVDAQQDGTEQGSTEAAANRFSAFHARGEGRGGHGGRFGRGGGRGERGGRGGRGFWDRARRWWR